MKVNPFQFGYCMAPIDFWFPLPTVADYVAHCQQKQPGNHISKPEMDCDPSEWQEVWEIPRGGEVLELLDMALEAAQERKLLRYWEGDFREGPYCLFLPDPDSSAISLAAFIWKQENNGSTFVVSRVELPYLNDVWA